MTHLLSFLLWLLVQPIWACQWLRNQAAQIQVWFLRRKLARLKAEVARLQARKIQS